MKPLPIIKTMPGRLCGAPVSSSQAVSVRSNVTLNKCLYFCLHQNLIILLPLECTDESRQFGASG